MTSGTFSTLPNRRDVADEIELSLAVRDVDGVLRVHQEQRVT
jgi:hypothetical protein